jgi:hypothetical protein
MKELMAMTAFKRHIGSLFSANGGSICFAAFVLMEGEHNWREPPHLQAWVL